MPRYPSITKILSRPFTHSPLTHPHRSTCLGCLRISPGIEGACTQANTHTDTARVRTHTHHPGHRRGDLDTPGSTGSRVSRCRAIAQFRPLFALIPRFLPSLVTYAHHLSANQHPQSKQIHSQRSFGRSSRSLPHAGHRFTLSRFPSLYPSIQVLTTIFTSTHRLSQYSL